MQNAWRCGAQVTTTVPPSLVSRPIRSNFRRQGYKNNALHIVLIALSQIRGAQSDFLFISSPGEAQISWVHLGTGGNIIGRPTVLIGAGEGLKHPQGITVDPIRRKLYVAEPDSSEILSYGLHINGAKVVVRSGPTVVAKGIESRWVAVDPGGSLYYTVEPKNEIVKIEFVPRSLRSLSRQNTKTILYTNTAKVNAPGGLAADNLNVFWTNKHFATEAGSLVAGSSLGDKTATILSKNSAKCYGACIGFDNVFFTDSTNNVYAVAKKGGIVKVVTSTLERPRGCTYDAAGTVFVADRGAGAVFAFPANVHAASEVGVQRVFDIDDAFGLAFLQSGLSGRRSWGAIVLFSLLFRFISP